MTLVEIMVATGLGSLVLLVLGSLTLYSARSFNAMVNYTDLNRESRNALDSISREIRQSRGLLERTPTSLVFKLNSGKLSYTYDPEKKTLVQASDLGTNTILKNCTSWSNLIFQRTPPEEGSDEFTETSDPASCKMVQISWVCSTAGSQLATNSESVQSMKVVIRKKPD